MIPAVAQTLANLLAGGTSLINTEQIDFSHPGLRQDIRPVLNLYCYSIQENNRMPPSRGHKMQGLNAHRTNKAIANSAVWFDVSFLLIAWDHTALGEQQLLSEALALLLRHSVLPENFRPPALRDYGILPMHVSASKLANVPAFWGALGISLRPALNVTVTIPFDLARDPPLPESEQLVSYELS